MPLRTYQEKAAAFLETHERAILGDAPGTGKTPVALSVLERCEPRRILLVTPSAVCHHWAREAEVWFPGLHVLDGRGAKAKRARARAAVVDGFITCSSVDPVALLLNYESFRGDVGDLLRLRFDCAVFDEAHRAKNRNSQITRAARLVARRVRRLMLVSGTVVPNRPDELWSLLHLVDPQRWPSYWRWVEQHCYTSQARFPGASRYTKVITGLRPGAIDAIRAELDGVLLQRSMEELLPSLPEATITVLPVDLDPEERRAYRDLARRHWTQLDDGTVIQTTNAVSRITRWRQIVSNLEALGATRQRVGSKIRAACDLVSDLDPEQVVVLTWSRAAAERVATETGGAYVHGGVIGDERRRRLEAFRAGGVRVIAGTLATLGEGVDGMQVARHVILLDRPWRPSDEDQAIGRIRRSGQVSAVFAWVLSATNTIDDHINDLLDSKRSVIDALRTGELVAP